MEEVKMKLPSWIKDKIQRDPSLPLSGKEFTGFAVGIVYLGFMALSIFVYTGALFKPSKAEADIHRRCVLVATELAKGSDMAYKDSYRLCREGAFAK